MKKDTSLADPLKVIVTDGSDEAEASVYRERVRQGGDII
jgi:hypothetical protein